MVYIRQQNLSPNPTLTIPGNTQIWGSFMFEYISLVIENNSAFDGYLLTNGESITFSNGSNLSTGGLYYAPNASVTFLQQSTLKGSIIAKEVYVENGTIITYVPMDSGDFPFYLMDPTTGGIPYSGGDYVYSYTFDPITELD